MVRRRSGSSTCSTPSMYPNEIGPRAGRPFSNRVADVSPGPPDFGRDRCEVSVKPREHARSAGRARPRARRGLRASSRSTGWSGALRAMAARRSSWSVARIGVRARPPANDAMWSNHGSCARWTRSPDRITGTPARRAASFSNHRDAGRSVDAAQVASRLAQHGLLGAGDRGEQVAPVVVHPISPQPQASAGGLRVRRRAGASPRGGCGGKRPSDMPSTTSRSSTRPDAIDTWPTSTPAPDRPVRRSATSSSLSSARRKTSTVGAAAAQRVEPCEPVERLLDAVRGLLLLLRPAHPPAVVAEIRAE